MHARPRLRSSNGCDKCRQRGKKCDEIRPICTACTRLRLQCTWGNAVQRRAGQRVNLALHNVAQSQSASLQLVSPPSIDSSPTTSPCMHLPIWWTEDRIHGGPAIQIPRDPMNYGTGTADNHKHRLMFDSIICKKVLPMAVRFNLQLENGKNVILLAAARYPPLSHAVCAITLLHGGLNERPELLAGSFQHYGRAIAACRETRDEHAVDTEARFLLHFLLLIYDITCAGRHWPQDPTSWAIHVACLTDLIYKSPRSTNGRLVAYLSWYTLLLDSQAGLLGNPEAGKLAKAFLAHDRCLPRWPIAAKFQSNLPPVMLQKFLLAHQLNLSVFELFAEQSLLALQVRRQRGEMEMLQEGKKLAARTAIHGRVADLSWRQQRAWHSATSELLDGVAEEDFMVQQSVITTLTFAFARYQFNVLTLFLASLCPDAPDLTMSAAQREARCALILGHARKSVLSGDKENHHLAPGLCMAALSSRVPDVRDGALALLKMMEHAGLAGSVRRVRGLVEFAAAHDTGKAEKKEHDMLDPVDAIRELQSKFIVLGM